MSSFLVYFVFIICQISRDSIAIIHSTMFLTRQFLEVFTAFAVLKVFFIITQRLSFDYIPFLKVPGVTPIDDHKTVGKRVHDNGNQSDGDDH